MEGWIISRRTLAEINGENYSINRLFEEAEKQGITLEVFTPEQFDIIVTKDDRKSIRVNGEIRKLPDFVMPRMGAGTTYFALAVIRHLERLGVFIVNGSEAVEMVKDKLYSFQVLAENNLPVPKTMLAKFPVNTDLIEEQIGFPVVIKTLTGMKWAWVFLSRDKKSFSDTMHMVENIGKSQNLIFQQFVESSNGRDLRVFVVGWKVVACMQRTGKEGEFRANYSLGGSIEKFKVTPEIEWIATQSAKILGLEVTGIDLLFDNGHFKICEANSSPWFAGIESSTGVNISNEIFSYLKMRLGLYE